MKIVVTHNNADLDALACLIAATRLYEGAVAVGGTSLSLPVQRYLALHKDHYPLLAPELVDPAEVEEVVVVDVRDRRRLREVEHVLQTGPRIVAWDHHPASDWDVDAEECVVEPVGACITLLIEAMRERDIEIDPDEATLYLLGLYSDTGRLSYATTGPRDLDAASFLLRRGAQLKVVNRYLRGVLSERQGELLVDLLATAEEISIDAVEIAIATASARKTVAGAAAVVQQVMELGGHDAMFAVLEFKNRVQVIGRSCVSYVDIGQTMREFGGGGHRGAGAGSVKGESLDHVVGRLKKLLRDTPLTPTRVEEIMSSPVRFLEHNQTLQAAGESFTDWDISGAPVLRDGNLCGVISRRDVARATDRDSLQLPVSSFMSHNVRSVNRNEPVEDALEMMTQADVGRMPVVDGEEIVGIVTRTDLIRLLYMRTWDDDDFI